MARILAVDWGERRIGLAVSDPTGTIASGLPTLEIRTPAEGSARVAAIAAEQEADEIVIGLPLLLSGERGEAARAAEAFAAAVGALVALPVHTWDERLTSALAHRRMQDRGERTRGGKGRVDQDAAIVLCESWLQKRAADARRADDARHAAEDDA